MIPANRLSAVMLSPYPGREMLGAIPASCIRSMTPLRAQKATVS